MSRAYRFPLARVARVRALVERIARSEWAAANARAEAAKDSEQRARTQLAEARAQGAGSRGPGSLDPLGVVAAETGLDALARRAADRGATAQTLTFQAGQYEAAWRERDQDVRALEKLEGRARIRHREAMEAAERLELDETARVRHGRKRKELPSPSSDQPFVTDVEVGGVSAMGPEEGPEQGTDSTAPVPHR